MKTLALYAVFCLLCFTQVGALEIGVKPDSDAVYCQTVQIFVTGFVGVDSIAISNSNDPRFGKFFWNVYNPEPASIRLFQDTAYHVSGHPEFTGNCASPDSSWWVVDQSTPYLTTFADMSNTRPLLNQWVASYSRFQPTWPSMAWLDSVSVYPGRYYAEKPGAPDRIDTTINVNLCGDSSLFFQTYDEDTWVNVVTPDSLQDTVWQEYWPLGMQWFDQLDNQLVQNVIDTFKVLAVAYRFGYEIDRAEVNVIINWSTMFIQVNPMQFATGADDQVAYRKSFGEGRIVAFRGNGSGFQTRDEGEWSATQNDDTTKSLSASADVDGDGLKDFVRAVDAGVHSDGRRIMEIEVLLSREGHSTVQDSVVWCRLIGYDLRKVVGMVSYDWDNDGDDDIAMIYDYGLQSNGKYLTTVHMFLSNHVTLEYQGSNGWIRIVGYNAQKVKGAAAGDFKGDDLGGIALVYDYGLQSNGKYKTAIHMLLSNGSSFVYQGSNGWWIIDGYPSNGIVKIFSFNVNGDGYTDFGIVYDYGVLPDGRYRTAIHAWISNGAQLVYQGSNGFWIIDGYEARRVAFALPGYYNADSLEDLSLVYRYSDRIAKGHVFLSGADTLVYQGSNGWWASSDFPLDSIAGMVSGNFTEPSQFGLGKVAAGNTESTRSIPVMYSVGQNYPNPFNPLTVIEYQLGTPSQVRLTIYNIIGQKVGVLVDERQQPGSYQVTWDASKYASGVYLYEFTADNFRQTKKMMLLK